MGIKKGAWDEKKNACLGENLAFGRGLGNVPGVNRKGKKAA